jgi:hypothetical protein
MLIEQIHVAFHHSLELQRRMMTSDSPEAMKIYNSAACSLLAEFRRLTGAVQNYRSPRQKKQFVVVRQQNLAGGNQQIALIDNPSSSSSTKLHKENDSSSELNGTTANVLSYQPAEAPFPEPQTGSRREEELSEARPVDGGKQGKTPRRHAKKQALEILDGAKES